ncbi:MAG: hypothetical protein ACRC5T_14095 [Cetobacterium sp.]
MYSKIEKLKLDVNFVLNHTEGRNIDLNGVKNLTISELEEILFYLGCLEDGTAEIYTPPYGAVLKVISSYGIKTPSVKKGWW